MPSRRRSPCAPKRSPTSSRKKKRSPQIEEREEAGSIDDRSATLDRVSTSRIGTTAPTAQPSLHHEGRKISLSLVPCFRASVVSHHARLRRTSRAASLSL